MESSPKKETSDQDIRHFIYTTFGETGRPPTTLETAGHFNISIAAVEGAYERLGTARSMDHLDAWLSRRNVALGYVMPMQTCWELAQSWYKGRLEHGWQRPDPAKIQQLFDSLGRGGAFWDFGRTS